MFRRTFDKGADIFGAKRERRKKRVRRRERETILRNIFELQDVHQRVCRSHSVSSNTEQEQEPATEHARAGLILTPMRSDQEKLNRKPKERKPKEKEKEKEKEEKN